MQRARQNLDLVRRVKAWIAEAARPPEGAFVLAVEVECAQPDCPPVETMTAVMLPNGETVRRKIPCPIAEVTEASVAEAWAGALAAV